MTISMPDSITPANMPRGYPAYLAYVDGARSADAPQVRAMFTGARILTLTVLGGAAVADGCDREPGDLSAAGAAAWLRGRILAGAWRPVLYDSRDDIPGTLGELAQYGIRQPQVRVWSAHYGLGQHICGPLTCGASFQADATQWTDTFPGVAGAAIDMSLLDDGFFGTSPVSTGTAQVKTTEEIVQQLPVLQQGATGAAVRRVQGLLVAAGYDLGTSGARKDGIDGSYGAVTATAIRQFQAASRIGVDGVTGPAQTWPALLGV